MNRTILWLASISIFLQILIYVLAKYTTHHADGEVMFLSLYFIVAFFVSLHLFYINFKAANLKTRFLNGIGTFLTLPSLYIIVFMILTISSLFPKKRGIEDIQAYDTEGKEIPIDSAFAKISVPKDTIVKIMEKANNETENFD